MAIRMILAGLAMLGLTAVSAMSPVSAQTPERDIKRLQDENRAMSRALRDLRVKVNNMATVDRRLSALEAANSGAAANTSTALDKEVRSLRSAVTSLTKRVAALEAKTRNLGSASSSGDLAGRVQALEDVVKVQGSTVQIKSSGALKLEGATSVEVKGGATAKLIGGAQTEVSGTIVRIKGGGQTTVEGAQVVLGGSSGKPAARAGDKTVGSQATQTIIGGSGTVFIK